jgi:putative methionine-R-sulfoxide reductase with GAF domain
MNRILAFVQKRLQRQLLLIFLPLVIFPVIVIGGIFATQWTQAVTEDIIRFESEHLTQEVHDLETALGNVTQDIFLMRDYKSVQQLGRILLTSETGSEFDVEIIKQNVLDDFSNMADIRKIYGQIRFIDTAGFEAVRVDYDPELNEISQPEGTDKGDRPYFIETINLADGELYVSPLELNREGSPSRVQGTFDDNSVVPVLRYGTPIIVEHPDTGRVETAGVLVVNVYMKDLLNAIVPSLDEGFNYLVNAEGYYLNNSTDSRLTFGFEDGIELAGGVASFNMQTATNDTFYFPEDTIDTISQPINEVVTSELDFGGSRYLVDYLSVNPPGAPYHWTVIEVVDEQFIFGEIQQAQLLSIIGIIGVAIVSGVITVYTARQIANPLNSLSITATDLASGNLTLRSDAGAGRQDEIGELNIAFNAMAGQLEEIVTNFESNLNARTRDLQTVVDVSSQIATILDVDRLLQDVVDLTKERFGLYHAHIYTMDDVGEILRLVAGAGHTGRQMVSEVRTIDATNRQSIVATAARTRRGAYFNDVASSPEFLAHPLLPNTKSELAVPLIARGQVLGVLDVQGDEVDYFNDETLSVLEILANQIATALSNASLFESADRSSRHEQALGAIDRQIQQATDVDEVLQITVRELGKALRVPHTSIKLGIADTNNGEVFDV